MKFLDLWYVLICTNDMLIITGSVIKGLIETRSTVEKMWNICRWVLLVVRLLFNKFLFSMTLGIGSMLVWLGVLRYLGFYKTYNILLVTMKGAAPHILRFFCCIMLLFVGFTLPGFVILGPYHFKFQTLMSTAECLFSLVNGDDMFATFSSIPRNISMPIWIFSMLYLFTFISFFIYFVLSVFISIIMDTYENIKELNKNGLPTSRYVSHIIIYKYDFFVTPFLTQCCK